MLAPSGEVHSQPIESLFKDLESGKGGISEPETRARLKEFGPNILPTQAPPTALKIFVQQFRSPLIYVLGIAAGVSIALDDYSDAFFIGLVLMLNAVIGFLQEYSAEKSAQALRQLAASKCMVERDGEVYEVDSESLVLGDVVLLESGRKVPADLRLFKSHSLDIDESLLTGESESVSKDADAQVQGESSLADRKNMAFTGSLVTRGRGKGLVVAKGLDTELGKIASSLGDEKGAKPPLVIRMEAFTKKISIFLGIIVLGIGGFLLWKGESWHEVLMFSVAIAVSAIPEGLPIALTVALAIASRRMAKRNVIVRKLPAVEALGSCSFIATDKTGTLTVNQLTVQKIAFPNLSDLEVRGTGLNPEGSVRLLEDVSSQKQNELLASLIISGTLCNESQLTQTDGDWKGYGDAVDLAFLVLARKHKFNPNDIRDRYEPLKEIPFEPENGYAASLHSESGKCLLSAKGAFEKILPMCGQMLTLDGEGSVDADGITKQANRLAESGYRVLALAKKDGVSTDVCLEDELSNLVFIGLVGMIDPLRSEARSAIDDCRHAGIEVAMVTGDHPVTALAIAKNLSLAETMDQVVTGPQLKSDKLNESIEGIRVFARVEPQQKLEIVRHLLEAGHFVAVTGDGANDAPALRMANVGVAMGKSGTDVAKETSDLIITDDRFASIVSGVEEGRIAYNNVRKVIYLLISTGAAEILLFILSLLFNTPLPLTAVQVLWLNLVTNGIQDVGLAFEPGEGTELGQRPRRPNEPVFDRLMLERIFLSAGIMGGASFFNFWRLIDSGVDEFTARNLTLLLMVLFQNIMVGNCRSETKSAFSLNPMNNRVLLFGTIIAQLIHIGALYTPGLRDILGVSPVTFTEWSHLFLIAISVLVAMEIYKRFRRI